MYNFFERWLAWAQAGAITDQFTRYEGLCFNYYIAGSSYSMDAKSYRIKRRLDLLPDAYPFGGIETYMKQVAQGTMHLNKKRLKWVRENVT